MTPINRQVARLGGTRVSRLNELNGRELKWLRKDLGVSPIKKCWRLTEMGPCKLRCCVAGGWDLEAMFVVDTPCTAELTVGDVTRICTRKHSDARHNFAKEAV